MKIGKTQNRIYLGLAIAALVAIFFYQVAYGKHGSSEYIIPPSKGWNQSYSWIQLTPSLMKHDTNDQRIEYNILNGSTWNSDGSTAKVSFDIAPPGCSYNGDRHCMWVLSYWNNQLTLNHSKVSSELTFKTVSHDHIELTDQYGGTKHLMPQQ
jgi:hypothetical protein